MIVFAVQLLETLAPTGLTLTSIVDALVFDVGVYEVNVYFARDLEPIIGKLETKFPCKSFNCNVLYVLLYAITSADDVAVAREKP